MDTLPTELDTYLSACVREKAFDFEEVAVAVQTHVTAAFPQLSADTFTEVYCRKRFAHLEKHGIRNEKSTSTTATSKVEVDDMVEEAAQPLDVQTGSDGRALDLSHPDYFKCDKPSDFTIFTHNLKNQISGIMNDVKGNLPAISLADEDDSDDTDDSDAEIEVFDVEKATKEMLSSFDISQMPVPSVRDVYAPYLETNKDDEGESDDEGEEAPKDLDFSGRMKMNSKSPPDIATASDSDDDTEENQKTDDFSLVDSPSPTGEGKTDDGFVMLSEKTSTAASPVEITAIGTNDGGDSPDETNTQVAQTKAQVDDLIAVEDGQRLPESDMWRGWDRDAAMINKLLKQREDEKREKVEKERQEEEDRRRRLQREQEIEDSLMSEEEFLKLVQSGGVPYTQQSHATAEFAQFLPSMTPECNLSSVLDNIDLDRLLESVKQSGLNMNEDAAAALGGGGGGEADDVLEEVVSTEFSAAATKEIEEVLAELDEMKREREEYSRSITETEGEDELNVETGDWTKYDPKVRLARRRVADILADDGAASDSSSNSSSTNLSTVTNLSMSSTAPPMSALGTSSPSAAAATESTARGGRGQLGLYPSQDAPPPQMARPGDDKETVILDLRPTVASPVTPPTPPTTPVTPSVVDLPSTMGGDKEDSSCSEVDTDEEVSGRGFDSDDESSSSDDDITASRRAIKERKPLPFESDTPSIARDPRLMTRDERRRLLAEQQERQHAKRIKDAPALVAQAVGVEKPQSNDATEKSNQSGPSESMEQAELSKDAPLPKTEHEQVAYAMEEAKAEKDNREKEEQQKQQLLKEKEERRKKIADQILHSTSSNSVLFDSLVSFTTALPTLPAHTWAQVKSDSNSVRGELSTFRVDVTSLTPMAVAELLPWLLFEEPYASNAQPFPFQTIGCQMVVGNVSGHRELLVAVTDRPHSSGGDGKGDLESRLTTYLVALQSSAVFSKATLSKSAKKHGEPTIPDYLCPEVISTAAHEASLLTVTPSFYPVESTHTHTHSGSEGSRTTTTIARDQDETVQTVVSVLKHHAWGNADALGSIVERGCSEGLDLVGLRLCYPTEQNVDVLKHSVSPSYNPPINKPALAMVFRGTGAHAVWENAVGPEDPIISRTTDPGCLRAMHGVNREDNLMTCSRPGGRDLPFWFGGRALQEDDSGTESSTTATATASMAPAFTKQPLVIHYPLGSVLLLLSPLVSPKYYSVVLDVCLRRGFRVARIKRVLRPSSPSLNKTDFVSAKSDSNANHPGLCLAIVLQKENASTHISSTLASISRVVTATTGMAAAQLLWHVHLPSQFQECTNIGWSQEEDAVSGAAAGGIEEQELSFLKRLTDVSPAPRATLLKDTALLEGSTISDAWNPESEQLVVLTLTPDTMQHRTLAGDILGAIVADADEESIGQFHHSTSPSPSSDSTSAANLGLEILGIKAIPRLPTHAAHELSPYETTDFWWSESVDFITSGPVMVVLLRGMDAAGKLERLVGPCSVKQAKATAPESLRAKHAIDDIRNVALVAKSPKVAYRQICAVFDNDELCSDATVTPVTRRFFAPDDPTVPFKKQLLKPLAPTLTVLGLMPANLPKLTTSRFLKRVEREGFKIVGMRMCPFPMLPSESQHPSGLRSGDGCFAVLVERINAVSHSMALVGPRDLTDAKKNHPWSLRGCYCKDTDAFYAPTSFLEAETVTRMLFKGDLVCVDTSVSRCRPADQIRTDFEGGSGLRSWSLGDWKGHGLKEMGVVVMSNSAVRSEGNVVHMLQQAEKEFKIVQALMLWPSSTQIECIGPPEDECRKVVGESGRDGPMVVIAVERDNALARVHALGDDADGDVYISKSAADVSRLVKVFLPEFVGSELAKPE